MTWRELVKAMAPGKKYSWNDLQKIATKKGAVPIDIRKLKAIITSAWDYINFNPDTGNYSLTEKGEDFLTKQQ